MSDETAGIKPNVYWGVIEEHIIGRLFTDGDLIHKALEFLSAGGDDFEDPILKNIFRIQAAVVNTGGMIDLVSVVRGVEQQYPDADINEYSFRCTEMEARYETSLRDYAKDIAALYERTAKRRIATKLDVVKEKCEEGTLADVRGTLIGALEGSVNPLQRAVTAGFFREPVVSRIATRWASRKAGLPASGITSGLATYDDMTGGFHSREMVVCAARPGVGKTMCAVHHAICTAQSGVATGVWSLEMDRDSILERFVANVGGLDHEKIRSGDFRGDLEEEARYQERIEMALTAIDELPLYFYDQNTTISNLITSLYIAHKKNGIKVFYIDYLQRIYADLDEKYMRRSEQVEMAARRLKEFAKANDVAIVVFAQINRAAMSNPNAKPELENLRDSGGIEQEADVVTLLYRPDKDQKRNLAMDIAKSRHGKVAEILLWAEYEKFFIKERF